MLLLLLLLLLLQQQLLLVAQVAQLCAWVSLGRPCLLLLPCTPAASAG
jgi:hypothetical protein